MYFILLHLSRFRDSEINNTCAEQLGVLELACTQGIGSLVAAKRSLLAERLDGEQVDVLAVLVAPMKLIER
jgi:hypothetical protein